MDGLLWTLDGDTLLALDRARLDLDLPALLRRDLHVRRVEADVRLADVPALNAATTGDGAVEPETSGGGVPWLRDGALAPLPSAAVDSIAITCRRLVAAPGRIVVDASATGGLDLRRDHDPRLVLNAAARDAGDAWAPRHPALGLGPPPRAASTATPACAPARCPSGG